MLPLHHDKCSTSLDLNGAKLKGLAAVHNLHTINIPKQFKESDTHLPRLVI